MQTTQKYRIAIGSKLDQQVIKKGFGSQSFKKSIYIEKLTLIALILTTVKLFEKRVCGSAL